MTRYFLIIIALLAVIGAEGRTYSIDEIPNVQVADHTRHLSDPDAILTAAARTEIDSTLSRVRRATSAEVAAVIVGDIDDDIDNFATRLYNSWGIGKKDNNNGVLILVARDARKAVIRTGRGSEGVLPDIVCARIMREKMFPAFREGDYDRGMVETVNAVADVITDPDAAAELQSRLKDNYRRDEVKPFRLYVFFCVVLALSCLAALMLKIHSLRDKSPYDKYTALEGWKAPLLIATAGGMLMPLIASLPLLLLLRYWRNRPRKCPNCGHSMIKIDEVHDNDYLTPAQDAEERIGSVDYDVWTCPECNETDIFPFVNKSMPMTVCEKCHARTARLTADRILVQPTTAREGVGCKDYTCVNCHHIMSRRYPIAKLPPVIIAPIGGGKGGGFGGGSFGGGFGGGITGGGGSSGGW